MRKLLQISNYLYPNIGGIEQVARDIMNSLQDQDICQKVICFNEDAQDGEFVCHRKETVSDQVDGVEVIRCGCFTKVASQSLSLTYPRRLNKVLKEFDPDIVILHYPNPYVSSFLIPMLSKKVHLILYWHLDITKQKILGKLFHGQTLTLLRRADHVVATSPNYIEGSPYLRQFCEKCVVVSNCVRMDRFTVTPDIQQKAAEIRDRYKGKIISFAVGRHVPYKGITYLIQASKFLDENFAVLIGGKGPLTDSLENEAREDRKITFLGRVCDEDLIAYYLACDIIAFPSITKNEAFGISLAEGMSFGKPAVTFTIPGSGVNYVNLDGVTGIECPNCDSKAYAAALSKLAGDEQLRAEYGGNARERVLALFTEEQFKKNIWELLELKVLEAV